MHCRDSPEGRGDGWPLAPPDASTRGRTEIDKLSSDVQSRRAGLASPCCIVCSRFAVFRNSAHSDQRKSVAYEYLRVKLIFHYEQTLQGYEVFAFLKAGDFRIAFLVGAHNVSRPHSRRTLWFKLALQQVEQKSHREFRGKACNPTHMNLFPPT